MSSVVILGVFVADTTYRAARQPRMGETILGSNFALGPGGKGSNQAVAAGKGESKGITPYGIDYSPIDGMIWYSKLNGNRIGGDGDGTLPGPVTLKLMRAFIDLAGMDFVAQALEMLSANEAADSLAEWRVRLAD